MDSKAHQRGRICRSRFTHVGLDWIRLAGAMGVEGARAETLEKLVDLLATSNRRKGPVLDRARDSLMQALSGCVGDV